MSQTYVLGMQMKNHQRTAHNLENVLSELGGLMKIMLTPLVLIGS